MSEKTKKNIRVSLAFSQGVVQSLIVYYTYQQYKWFCCKVFQKIYFSVKLRKKTERTK
ncbi:hypothetical protein [Enterococcus faecium]|uniref:hypothetical protein n=1 Tax=Enterococcus faecium TaxID=1352 RepID=UPI000A456CA8|nr:hypothetical protein [Enterococcus faecium]